MHNNSFNHFESECTYKHYVLNIAYRYKFKIHEENDVIYKTENDIITKIVDSDEVSRNIIWFHAWKKLEEEYGYNGYDYQKQYSDVQG